jgi:hypothetical protein
MNICVLMERDPSIEAAQPPGQPLIWSRTNGIRIPDWLLMELKKRGMDVNATPSECSQ